MTFTPSNRERENLRKWIYKARQMNTFRRICSSPEDVLGKLFLFSLTNIVW